MTEFDPRVLRLAMQLDEMLLKGRRLDDVEAFLQENEDCFEGIYAASAFAYDMYDLYTHPNRKLSGFLLDHIHLLPNHDEWFAVESYVTRELESVRMTEDELNELRERQRAHDNFDMSEFAASGWDGASHDIGILLGRRTFLQELKRRTFDCFRRFLSQSRSIRSAFMLDNYRKMSTDQRARLIVMSISRAGFGSSYIKNVLYIRTMAKMLASLLRQLLLANEWNLFNWTMWMVGDIKLDEDEFSDTFSETLAEFIPRHLFDIGLLSRNNWPIDPNVADMRELHNLVFELNLMGFDQSVKFVELFIYLYTFHPHYLRDENVIELLEYFNLPFNYAKLLKDWEHREPMGSSAIKSRLA